MALPRKSARVTKRKWACGSCGLQCNDDSVFCECCRVWHHAKCERLSANDLRVLHRLTEDYLCLSCTHLSGVYDFPGALKRLEDAARVGTLEAAVKMENIFLRCTPPVRMRADEQQFGTRTLDAVAQHILRNFGKYSKSSVLPFKYYLVVLLLIA